MSFETIAQELIVLEPLEPMEHSLSESMPELHVADHDHSMNHSHSFGHGHDLSIANPNDLTNKPVSFDVKIIVEEIPGAGNNLPDVPQEEISEVKDTPVLEVVEESGAESTDKKSKETSDENDARKSKKSEKWDWESKGAEGFISWIKERLETVPRHSGMDSAGLERAIFYLEKLDSEISKAMRLDLEGDLDANKIEEVRSKIDDGLSRLYERLDKVKKSKKNYKKKKAKINLESPVLIKEAQKITGVQGIYVTVPLLISRVARVCINGMVSAGHDIEDLYNRQVKLYKLNNREQAEVMQLLADMGYPIRQDRGFMPEDALEVSDSDGMDFASNYKG